MISSDFRTEARRKLEGKWGKAVCIFLAYAVSIFVIKFIGNLFPDSMQSLVSLAVIIIDVPLNFGLMFSLLKLYNGDDVNASDVFTLGFSNFAKSWKVSFSIALKMIVPVILMVVSYILIAMGIFFIASSAIYGSSSSTSFLAIIGFLLLIISTIWIVVRSYYYQLAYFIAFDNTNMTGKEIVEKSQELMTGNRGKLFVLELSFIGWAILAFFTLGIGYLWLVPYFQFAKIAFYKFLTGETSSIKNETFSENSNQIED